MSLKMQTITYHKVEYYDLDSFIFNHFGIQFETIVELECQNDTSHEVYADANMTPYDRGEIDKWLQGESAYVRIHDILSYASLIGLIPEGRYLINVSW